MNVESLIKILKSNDGKERSRAIEKLSLVAAKTKYKKEYILILRALNYAANNDPEKEIRNRAIGLIRALRDNPPQFIYLKKAPKKVTPKRVLNPARIIFLFFILIVFFALVMLLLDMDFYSKDQKKLENVKSLEPVKIEDMFNPLKVKSVKPPEFFKGVSLIFMPKVGSVLRSHIKDITTRKSGGDIIDVMHVNFDLKRVVTKILPGKDYEVEFSTYNAVSPLSIRYYGFPDPGKKIKKLFSRDGKVKSIKGDIYGIVPIMAFINRYTFPDKKIKPGEIWRSDLLEKDVESQAVYKFEKILNIQNRKLYLITYARQMKFESISIITRVAEEVAGEIFIDYLTKEPVYSREISIVNMKKPESRYGFEIETMRTEIFSGAEVFFKEMVK